MVNNSDCFFDENTVKQLLQSETGQELAALLKASNSEKLNAAKAAASNGDYAQAQKAVGDFLQSKDAQKIMDLIGGGMNGGIG